MLMELIEESKKYLSDKNVSELINKEESISELEQFLLYVILNCMSNSLR